MYSIGFIYYFTIEIPRCLLLYYIVDMLFCFKFKVISGKTERLKYTSTMTDFSRFTTFLSHSIKAFTNKGEDSTVRKSTPKTTNTTSKSNKNNIGKR